MKPKTIPHALKLPNICHDIAWALKGNESEVEVYIVGGAVRDDLMGLTPKDFDMVTNLSEEEIRERLGRAGTNLTVKAKSSDTFGVVFVSNGDEHVEVAPFRSDLNCDGRKPVGIKTGVGMLEDSRRRDFTINSLYNDFGYGKFAKYQTIDFHGGIEDIKTNTVRCVGNPTERFREDRLRILRFVRFSCRYNEHVKPDNDTVVGITKLGRLRETIEGLPPISKERIVEEFGGIIKQAKDVRGGTCFS